MSQTLQGARFTNSFRSHHLWYTQAAFEVIGRKDISCYEHAIYIVKPFDFANIAEGLL